MSEVRTRFAPSPTGFMHIGNLRTALYSYLLAKSKNGKFVLRIEDTDQNRYVDGAVETIYSVLKDCGLNWDEGPDVGGSYGSYVQSERVASGIYMEYAKKLIETDNAYYCFCQEAKTDLDTYKEECNYSTGLGYNGHCRSLSKEEIEGNLKAGKPFVIRQKMPNNIVVTYKDEVYGEISFNTEDLDDQVLIKQDGFPTYNFANVVDDHMMNITHVVRGCEYLSSTPKYVLLYKSFGWNIPKFVHLPLIMGETDGVVSKLSKRNGSVTYDEFINKGYVKEAIINYIALLGWTPNGNQEFFDLNTMIKLFNVKNLNKSSAIFDYKKLDWINGKYIRKMSDEVYYNEAMKFIDLKTYECFSRDILMSLKNKLNKFTEINVIIEPLFKYNRDFDLNYFVNEKIQASLDSAVVVLSWLKNVVESDNIDCLNDNNYYEFINIKKAVFMTALRVVLTGISFSMLDPIIMLKVMDKDEINKRIDYTIKRIVENK